MGHDLHSFIELLEKERDAFLVHLKMCKYSKQMAMSTIQNKTKKAIQDATSTTQAMLKTAFRAKDYETIDDLLEEAIQDKKEDQLVKEEVEVFAEGDEGSYRVKKQIPFKYNNEEMKKLFMKEFRAGFISNTSLKWFSKILNIDHILKSDFKFGNFWNLVLTQAVIIKLKWFEKRFIDGKHQDVQLEHKEKFRLVDQHQKVDIFHFDNKNFMFTGTKTAIQVEEQIPF